MTPSSALPPIDGSPARRALWIPGLFVLGFLIVIAVNAFLIVAAVKSFSGLETDGAYDRGIHYNQVIAAAVANDRTGWQATLELAQAGAARQLLVTMRDRDGKPVSGATLTAHLVRPTNAGMDMTLPLKRQDDGYYAVTFTPTALGNWELRLVARDGDRVWQHTQRIFLK